MKSEEVVAQGLVSAHQSELTYCSEFQACNISHSHTHTHNLKHFLAVAMKQKYMRV
jgi:hypothetical protein